MRHLKFWRRRVPVSLQLSAVECGAACLAMILNYYGRHVTVADCREQCQPGRDGVTAHIIATAARYYGLRVKAYSIEPADMQHLPLPAIVHWKFNHFTVVERWSPTHVDVVDPAHGRSRLSAAEFDSGFTGVVLALTPGIQFERQKGPVRATRLNYLKSILRTPGIAAVLTQVLAASLIMQLLGLALPLFTEIIVDRVLPLRITSMMGMIGFGMVLMVLSQSILAYLRSLLLITLRNRLDAQLMLNFFEHLLTLPFRYFQQRTSGDLLMRLSSNTSVRETLTSQSMSVILDGSFVIIYLIVLFSRAPTFGLLVLGLGLLQVILLLGTTSRVHVLMQRSLAAQAESQSYLVETLKGVATLKASGAEARAFDHWSTLFFNHMSISLERSRLSALVSTAMSALRTFSPLILLWVGALQVLNGELSLGTMFALNALAAAFLAPFTSLASTSQQLQLVTAHLERIADVLEAEPEQFLCSGQTTAPANGRIEIKNADFKYDAHSPAVLTNISVTVNPGQKIAIVGRTGSGKSTLAMLLLGLYQPNKGSIFYDGANLQHMNYRAFRSQCGVVLQEPFLFSGSIRHNIALNRPDLSLEAVMKAARLAAVHDEIMAMPMQYETNVAEGGSALSGGQRQRLALARALAHRPAILFLDEATSHLDVVTERRIYQNLNTLPCTQIIIAHRLSTIKNADLILVLSNGTIVERGSHETLLAQGGCYGQLVQSQVSERGEPELYASPATAVNFP
jgi:HlyB family type I secretion system ABC transporter